MKMNQIYNLSPAENMFEERDRATLRGDPLQRVRFTAKSCPGTYAAPTTNASGKNSATFPVLWIMAALGVMG